MDINIANGEMNNFDPDFVAAYKNNYLELLNPLNNRLTQLKWFYSYDVFLDGIVDENKLDIIWQMPRKCVLVLDRNIFSWLIMVITRGTASDNRTKDISILITWAILMRMDIYPLFALNECAETSNIPNRAQFEYESFKHIYDEEHYLDWLSLVTGKVDSFQNTITVPDEDVLNSSLNVDIDSIDYKMNYASMLYFVYVLRIESDNVKRFILFFEWLYSHLLVSRFTEVYVIQVLLNTPGFKAPKKAHGDNFENTKHGCENQARDLSYLTRTSIDRWPAEVYEPVLVTDDHMLGELFKLGCYENCPIKRFEKGLKGDTTGISQWVDDLLKNHQRVNPSIDQLDNIISELLEELRGTFN